MLGFKVMEVNFGSGWGKTVRVANDDGVELEYHDDCRPEHPMRTLTVSASGIAISYFDFEAKCWKNRYGMVCEAPMLWREEMFQVVDKMVELVEKGSLPL